VEITEKICIGDRFHTPYSDLEKAKKERIVENYRDRMYYEKPSMKRKREKARRKKVLEKLRWKRESTLNNY